MNKRLRAALRVLGDRLSGRSSEFPYVETYNSNQVAFKYWITDSLYKKWYNAEGHYEYPETQTIRDFVSSGDRVLDLGCNNGFFMMFFRSLCGPKGFVLGLDVVPANVMISQAQVGLNNFTNMEALNVGAGPSRQKVFVQNVNNGFVVNEKVKGSIEIEVIPCDDLLTKFERFDTVKIDVEGYEGQVLKGCKQILATKPNLIIEMHGSDINKYGSSVREIFELIDITNYKGVYFLRSDGKMYDFELNKYPEKDHTTLFLTHKLRKRS